MNKIRLLIPSLFLCAVSFAQSAKRQSVNHTNIIKLGLNTFFDTDEFPLYINWEAKVGNNQSIQIGVLPRISKYNNDNTSGIGATIAFRKYISKNRSGISGLFVSPLVKVGFLKDEYSYSGIYNGNPPQTYYSSSSSKISQYNVGLVFGHNWVFKSGFSFEASGGFGYYNTKEKYTSNSSGSGAYSSNNNYSGILPQLQINFGYAF